MTDPSVLRRQRLMLAVAGVVVLALVAVIATRVDTGVGQVAPGELADALDGGGVPARIAQALRAPGPDGTRYPAGTTGLMIAEVVVSNASTLLDEDGETTDWIELFNPTSGAIDTAGFFLSDDDERPQRWRLPSRIIGPGERLIVFASGKDRAPDLDGTEDARAGAVFEDGDPDDVSAQRRAAAADLGDPDDPDADAGSTVAERRFAAAVGVPGAELPAVGAPGTQLHTDFALAQDGEPVILLEPDGMTIADRLPPVPVPRDASLGRHPTDVFRTCLFARATPGAPNADVCHEDLRLGAPELSHASGFHADRIEVRVDLLPAVTEQGAPPLPTAEPASDDDATDATASDDDATDDATDATDDATDATDAPADTATVVDAADAPVLYTLDGSYPDLDHNADATRTHDPADGPLTIPIDDRSAAPPQLAPIWTGFSNRFPQRIEPELDLQATVLRVRTPHGRESVATYFVGEGFRSLDLPVVSIATDPEHLFDHHTGIYVPGALYEAYVASDDYNPDHNWRVPANSRERGRAWERPFAGEVERAINFTYCDDLDDGCSFSQDVGLRIHGNFSRALPQKNLRVYARNDYGDRTLDHAFFGDSGPDEHRRLLLRVSGNDWGLTMLKDAYLQTLIRDLPMDTQAYQPAVLFINGEYWGIQNLRERYDRHYLAATHGVDPSQVAMLARGGIVDEGVEQDGQDYLDLIDTVEAAPAGDADVRARIERELDIEGLFDSVIVRTIVADTDWPQGNIRVWRVQTPPTGTAGDRDWPASLDEVQGIDDGVAGDVRDGRWRFMAFDLDNAGGGIGNEGLGHATIRRPDPDFDALTRFFAGEDHPDWAQDFRILIEFLLTHDDYRAAFVARYEHHLDTTFDPDRTLGVLEEQAGRIEGEMDRHARRWGYPTSAEAWAQHVDALAAFMAERPEVAREQLEAAITGE